MLPKDTFTPLVLLPRRNPCRLHISLLRRLISLAHLPPPPAYLGGSAEEDWYDSVAKFGSDSEDDFLSVRNDSLSPRGFGGASIFSVSSMKDDNHSKHDDNVPYIASNDDQTKQGEVLTQNPTVISVAENGGPLSPVTLNTIRKAGFILSLKSKKEQSNSTILSTKSFLRRPIAGSQVPLSPVEKKVFNSWSHIEPGSFKVRAENYLRDKKKGFSQNHAAYYPFGADVFLSQKKVDHIARFVELPLTSLYGKFPPLLVVNVQIPLYSPSLFQSENDGEGMSVVLYFRFSESYSKEIAPHFLENLRRVIDNEVEVAKASAVIPVRERLKILGRVANMDDLHLGAPERRLMSAYNGKPFLSRPQHEFYLGENYFEIDIDMHRFSYISKKGFDTFQDRLKHCILDVGLTIQGNKPEELPEQILCCMRLNGIDHRSYHQLVVGQ